MASRTDRPAPQPAADSQDARQLDGVAAADAEDETEDDIEDATEDTAENDVADEDVAADESVAELGRCH